jgi:hypothetical protein
VVCLVLVPEFDVPSPLLQDNQLVRLRK